MEETGLQKSGGRQESWQVAEAMGLPPVQLVPHTPFVPSPLQTPCRIEDKAKFVF